MKRSGTTLMAMGAALLATAAIALAVVALRDGGGGPAPTSDAPSTAEQLISFYQRRIDGDPADYVGYTKLGESYVRLARETGDAALYERAETALRTALELRPGDAVARAQLATVLIATHQFAEALAIAEAVYAEDPSATQALATAGDAHMALGNYDDARDAYETLAQAATAPSVYSRLAHVEEILGDTDAAETHLRRAETLAVERGQTGESLAWYRLQLGILHLNTGRYDDAERWFEASLDTLPDYYLARAGLGHVATARGDYALAIEQLELAVATVPQPALLADLGDLYARTGDIGAADDQYATVEFIGRLAEINRTIYNRELALFYADHTIKAGEAVRLALAELELRKDVYGYDAAAWALYRDGRVAQAAPLMAQALKLGTQDARLLIHAGLIARAMGDAAGTREYLARAFELNPHPSLLLEREARQALDASVTELADRGD